MGLLRIFVACPDMRLRTALFQFLEREHGMNVVGLSDRLPGLFSQLEGSQPDVLLLDWELSAQPIEELLTKFHNLESRPEVIILSARPNEKEKIMAAGADHFIPKDAPPDELLPILNRIRLSRSAKTMDGDTNITCQSDRD
jgi:DNA-binding NarL/FixJ family response regulator